MKRPKATSSDLGISPDPARLRPCPKPTRKKLDSQLMNNENMKVGVSPPSLSSDHVLTAASY